jgi:hypothetical protein
MSFFKNYVIRMYETCSANIKSYVVEEIHLICKEKVLFRYKNLQHVVSYLAGTPNMGITIRVKTLDPRLWIDAALAVHDDRKSHGGAVLTAGDGGPPLSWKSGKHDRVPHPLGLSPFDLPSGQGQETYDSVSRQYINNNNSIHGTAFSSRPSPIHRYQVLLVQAVPR